MILGWVIGALYVVGWFLTARAHARFRLDGETEWDDIEERVITAAMSMGVGLFWPLVVIGWAVTAQRRRPPTIEELEKRLGINDHPGGTK
jgi:cytochrome bd-type quinol oxidase subunit 1